MLDFTYLHYCQYQYQLLTTNNGSNHVMNLVLLYLVDPSSEVSMYITLSMTIHEKLPRST